MKIPLPVLSAIETIRWPLSTPACPMYYEPLTSLQSLRRPDSIPFNIQPLITDIPNTIHELTTPLFDTISDETSNDEFIQNKQNEMRYYIMTSLALLFLGNGFADEAHDLITPLSWNDETYFGGPTMISSTEQNTNIASMASYVHSLVHRKEAYARGEFGMIGFQNSNYWRNAAKSKYANDVSDIPYKQIKEAILNISNDYGTDAKLWCQTHILDAAGDYDDAYWDTGHLIHLCAHVLKQTQTQTQMEAHINQNINPISDEFKQFAEKAVEIELRVLLNCALQRAGYDIHNLLFTHAKDESNHPKHYQNEKNYNDHDIQYPSIDDNLALSVANKISSAHIGAFQSSGHVTIRNIARVLSDKDEKQEKKTKAISIAAGITCRLLGSSACHLLSHTDDSNNETLFIYIPTDPPESTSSSTNGSSLQEQLTTKFGSAFYGGGPLAMGDVFAFIGDSTKYISLLDQNMGLFHFISSKPNEEPLFVDRFHGSRGQTPTSVLQWSKGTIHKSI